MRHDGISLRPSRGGPLGNRILNWFAAQQVGKALGVPVVPIALTEPHLTPVPQGVTHQLIVRLESSNAPGLLAYKDCGRNVYNQQIQVEAHHLAQDVNEMLPFREDFLTRFFPGPSVPPKLANEEILIHVRAGDILRGEHRDYLPLPINFYQSILGQGRYRPVFVGQVLESNWYSRLLRRSFPNARFLAPSDPVTDFVRLMGASRKIISISTFAWLAAWLGPESAEVHQPVAGLFHPLRRPDWNLLPSGRPAWKTHWLEPYGFGPPPSRFPGSSRRRIEKVWKEMALGEED